MGDKKYRVLSGVMANLYASAAATGNQLLELDAEYAGTAGFDDARCATLRWLTRHVASLGDLAKELGLYEANVDRAKTPLDKARVIAERDQRDAAWRATFERAMTVCEEVG